MPDSAAAGSRPRHGADPRRFQVAFLLVFLAYVLAFREFTLAPAAMAVVLASVLITQAAFVHALALPDPGILSPLISGLSLCLLLRTNATWVAALAGVLSIASKFLLRARGKHFFNPTNFGLLATVLLTGRAWVSPAQWGSGTFLVFFLGALGMAVVRQARRIDVSLAFLVAHAGLNLARALYLGERLQVPLHRLSSGALILFAFFMISDPRSTPDARSGRILFAALAAALAYVLQFRLFIPSAPLWALLAVSPLTPLIDALWRRPRFEWRATEKGVPDASSSVSPEARPRPARA